jgi:hypothetical protein
MASPHRGFDILEVLPAQRGGGDILNFVFSFSWSFPKELYFSDVSSRRRAGIFSDEDTARPDSVHTETIEQGPVQLAPISHSSHRNRFSSYFPRWI